MKKLYFIAALGLSAVAFAQTTGRVGVNIDTPQATLDIKPNTANAATTATTNEGILIPRLTAARVTGITSANRVEGTMVYVTDAPSGTLFSDTTKGFYYWDPAANTTGQWVKMGGGAAAGSANLAPAKGTIRTVANITAAQWTATDFTIVLTNGLTAAELPLASSNAGRIIAIRNASAGNITYTANPPLNNTGINLNRGQLIQSDGTNWYVIGGF